MKPMYAVTLTQAKERGVRITQGNSKIGKTIWAFSTLPGNDKHLLLINNKSILLTNIPGTCSKFCEGCFNGGCYAVNAAKLYHKTVVTSWATNTLLLRAGLAIKQIDEFITKKNTTYYKTHKKEDLKVGLFRINVSGEITSAEELAEWNQLALNHPEVNFGVYIKNFDALDLFMQQYKDPADNFCINISEWHGVAKDIIAKYPQLNVFEYDDSNRKNCDMSPEEIERLSHVTACPAVDYHGHHTKTKDGNPITCDMCKRCYVRTGRRTKVWSH